MKIAMCLVLGLVTAVFAQEPRASSASESAAQGMNAANPEPQFALLRVYRLSNYYGAALYPSVYVDGKQVARVGSGRRVAIKLTPGMHEIK